eukprot:GFYU01000387.1.p1 GENE.GFYU01000387.1~~GFYU01000387.1.p1  ORF type:complete len:272 (+),score=23.50 GFYU01000387.1:41-856(+)
MSLSVLPTTHLPFQPLPPHISESPIEPTTSEMLNTHLKLSDDAWLETSVLPHQISQYAKEKFSELFDHHPSTRGCVVNPDGEQLEVKRWYMSYKNTPMYNPDVSVHTFHMFTGTDRTLYQKEVPEVFMPIVNCFPEFNQVTINWYSGMDKIAFHSDCEKYLSSPDIKVVSLQEVAEFDTETKWTFRLKRKSALVPQGEHNNVVNHNVQLQHGSVITMGGYGFQSQYRHGVASPLDTTHGWQQRCDPTPRRISIVFRNTMQTTTSEVRTLRE